MRTRFIKNPRTILVSKYLVLIAFVLAAFDSLAQFTAYPVLSGLAFKLAYFAFPFLIFSILLALYTYSWTLIREVWKNKRLKWLSWLVGVGYALFYILVTNTISVPDAGIPIPSDLSLGYVVPLEVYGPMTVWPDVEFYFPSINLVGYFSVGNVLFFVTLGFLATCAVTLLSRNLSARRGVDKGATGSIAGAVLTALSTNACCCCTPVLLPALAIFFGGTLPSAVVSSLVNPESPVSSLLVLATLASLIASVVLSTRTPSPCQTFPIGGVSVSQN